MCRGCEVGLALEGREGWKRKGRSVGEWGKESSWELEGEFGGSVGWNKGS